MTLDPFERHRRRLARFAVYGSLLAVAGLGVAARVWLERPAIREKEIAWFGTDWAGYPSVRLFQQLLRIDTGPQGDELAGALLLSSVLRAAGVPTTVERLADTRANLWADLAGDDERPLLLLSHLDVEPVLEDEVWLRPPFGGVIDPPYIWGRGTFDMKSYTVAQLWALLELREQTPKPRRSVRFMATSSEERGSDLGIRWLLWRHPELFDGLWGVLTEGGLVEARGIFDAKYWATEFGQKRFVTLDACAASEQRLVELRSDIVNETGFPTTGLRVLPEIERFWNVYAPSRDRDELVELFSEPQRLERDPDAFLRLPHYGRSMVRDELVPLSLEQEPDGSWRLHMIFHLLPDSDLESVMERLLPPWVRGGVSFVLVPETASGRMSPMDHPLVEGLERAVAARYDDIRIGPFFLPWTKTDARFLRERGIPVYGFSPFLIVTPETLRGAKAGEKISLPGFRDGVELYTELLERLAG